MVQRPGQLERRLGQRKGVVARVAVVEAHLQLDAIGELRLHPVRLLHPEPLGGEGARLLEGSGGEHGVAEPDATGQEPAGNEW